MVNYVDNKIRAFIFFVRLEFKGECRDSDLECSDKLWVETKESIGDLWEWEENDKAGKVDKYQSRNGYHWSGLKIVTLSYKIRDIK